MVLVSAAVDHDLGDARRLGAIGDDFADSLGRGDVAATLQSLFGFLVNRTGRDEGAAAAVVNHLRVDVSDGTVDVQAGTFRRADHARAHAQMHAAALLIFRQLANWYRSHVVSPSIHSRTVVAGLFPRPNYKFLAPPSLAPAFPSFFFLPSP